MRDNDVCGTTDERHNDNNKDGVELLWSDFKTAFETLDSTDQSMFVENVVFEKVDDACKLYKHCVARYNLDTWTGVPAVASVTTTLGNAASNNVGVIVIIVVATAISAIAIVGFVLTKKRKED